MLNDLSSLCNRFIIIKWFIVYFIKKEFDHSNKENDHQIWPFLKEKAKKRIIINFNNKYWGFLYK